MIDTAQDAQAPHRTTRHIEERPDAPGAPALAPAFAHRAAAEDVLVTGWHRHDATHFSVELDWSGPHVFFAPARGSSYHHMLIAQTLRQVGLGLTHAEFGVAARENHFLLDDLEYTVGPDLRTDATAPVRAEVEYAWTGRRSLRVRIDLRQHGRLCATGSSGFTWVPDGVYRRLRGDRLAARPARRGTPVAPSLVGRSARDEVTLSLPSEGGPADGWQLIEDTGHPALIDHAVDHVPGLVLLEAAQQAAYAFTGGGFDPRSVSIRAHQYVEFGHPCSIEARPAPGRLAGGVAVEVTGTQRGKVAFRCLVEGSVLPPA
ncbi:ScbA/BarX family gamma-butyrolactone biosynthesis protein [Streptomyces sp. NPDC058757]|uniref:ScbA/BarX family gamma-butyrolactone biosynthesis protein n=1 Tax=unclassified Streptomyces TaxID=2593676 RepID=UPI0036BA9965